MQAHPPATYRGLEGLRGLLAWLVVFSHIPLQTGIGFRLPGSYSLMKAGDWAVEVFIIVSGFVITHLLLTRAEPYRVFISRRAFRLVPAYLVCLALGVLVQPFELRDLADLPWGNEPRFMNHLPLQSEQIEQGNWGLHLGWHLTLLHGAIPNGILNEASLMFLPPAWSLSLEWQFYLLAPLLLMALRNYPVATFLAFAAAALAYKAGLSGSYFVPSFLPGALMIFLVGIATRLLFEKTGTFERFPLWLGIGAAALASISPHLIFAATWIVMAAYMKTDGHADDRPFRLLSRVLDSRPMRMLGERSYSVYLIHWPVIAATASFAVAVLRLGPWGTFLFTGIFGVFLTALGAEIVHRCAERPGIELGKRLFRSSHRTKPKVEIA